MAGISEEAQVSMHHISEQRCKHIGCRYLPCVRTKVDQAPCRTIMREFEACKKDEYANLLAEFQENGSVKQIAKIRKPDALRDIYTKGKAQDYDKKR